MWHMSHAAFVHMRWSGGPYGICFWRMGALCSLQQAAVLQQLVAGSRGAARQADQVRLGEGLLVLQKNDMFTPPPSRK